MRTLLILGLLLLSGCIPADISGVWINQPIIDVAAQGKPLNIHGTHLEWHIDTRAGKAQVRNGFEMSEGQLLLKSPNAWIVDYGGGHTDELQFDGKYLTQATNQYAPQEVFSRPTETVETGDNWVNTFVKALNTAYMAGEWNIIDGPGKGTTAMFTAQGRVSGLGQADRYTLCLDGDCRSQGAGNETLLLGHAGTDDTWIFVRKGKQLEIFQAVNTAQADEVPSFTPGPRQWLLEKQ